MELRSSMDMCSYIHRKLPSTQQQCLVSDKGGYIGCWDILCVSPRGSWIQDQCQ
jgi:hypothetical protein